MTAAYVLRPAVPADAERLAEVTAEAFEGYRGFAPAGWQPPPPAAEVDRLRDLLAGADLWCLVAERDGAVAGHTAFLPAAQAIHPIDEPQLAHVRALFVRPGHWGTGLARQLHSAALEAAAARGYTAMRLFTPADQGRARRFYEREGWILHAEPSFEAALGLFLVEYRYALTSP